jgi:D-alanyl-D-alanine carboxypeptidase
MRTEFRKSEIGHSQGCKSIVDSKIRLLYPHFRKVRCLTSILIVLCSLATAIADQVDDLVRDQMSRHPIPGLALEIIRDGKPVKIAAYGLADLEWKSPLTPETVFEIGSITKQFTASAIMLLAQEGKLSVDDKLSRHLKDTPEIWTNITLRHLLTHTSGIKNYTELDGFELSRHLTQAQFTRKIGAVPLDFPPGEKWSYCNSGFNLLGFVIENVSGQDYWQFMQQRIFGPLGMTNTTNRDPRRIIPSRAKGYETDAAGHFINRDSDLTDVFSAGAIVSTVGDLAKWNAALDAGQLLTPATEAAMWTPIRLNNGSTHDYGFGWYLSPLEGRRNIGHSGSTSGFSASFQRFPDDRLTVIVLTNSNEQGIGTKTAKAIALVYLGKQ